MESKHINLVDLNGCEYSYIRPQSININRNHCANDKKDTRSV